MTRSTRLPLQEACYLYEMPSDQFITFAMNKLSEDFDTSQLLDAAYGHSLIQKSKYIMNAAQSVPDGLDRIETTCWECGSCFPLQHYSQCCVVCYCSRECQMKSWKGGHKKVCKKMKGDFGRFMDDLELIDQAAAAAQDDTEATPKTNAFRDYMMRKEIWNGISADKFTPTGVLKLYGCPGPSVAIFHRNFKPTGSFPTKATSEVISFNAVAHILSFVTSALENNMDGIYEGFRRHFQIGDSGTTLTTKRFLQLYGTTDEFNEPLDEERDVEAGARIECVTRVLKAIKKKFNKN